jgi:hypothetical protein
MLPLTALSSQLAQVKTGLSYSPNASLVDGIFPHTWQYCFASEALILLLMSCWMALSAFF